jgi:hypothetical protein
MVRTERSSFSICAWGGFANMRCVAFAGAGV